MRVDVERTRIDDVVVVTPDAFTDDRGFFTEIYRRDLFAALGLPTSFVQVNLSRSVRNVVRGLHFQWDPPMGKLMRVARGRAFLVAVDLRKDSPTLGEWVSITASSEDRRQLWAPASFARGFCSLDDFTEVEYLCTATYNGSAESGIQWDDPEIGIDWPVAEPILSEKDHGARSLSDWLSSSESDRFRLEPVVVAEPQLK
ncbi:MAG: dTDP-4-dehydrorhamnose 3,5-epimerase [Acidimicrobiales bacterium]